MLMDFDLRTRQDWGQKGDSGNNLCRFKHSLSQSPLAADLVQRSRLGLAHFAPHPRE